MSRIHPLTRDEAAPEVRAIYDQNLTAYGQVMNTTGVYAYRPTIQLGVKALTEGIKASGLIPERLRCLINVKVASLIGCPY